MNFEISSCVLYDIPAGEDSNQPVHPSSPI